MTQAEKLEKALKLLDKLSNELRVFEGMHLDRTGDQIRAWAEKRISRIERFLEALRGPVRPPKTSSHTKRG